MGYLLCRCDMIIFIYDTVCHKMFRMSKIYFATIKMKIKIDMGKQTECRLNDTLFCAMF